MKPNTSFLGKLWLEPQVTSIEELKKLRDLSESDFHPAENMQDLRKAAERILNAIENKERILIVGDYDVDGVTASVILFKTLQTLGADVSVRLPHRERHGYGLNQVFIEEANELGVKLIITVDNGITAHSEIELANSLGIDVIITDHHLPAVELPAAHAIVNPRRTDCDYPHKDLCGAAVAMKIASVLLTESHELHREFLALAALATIADVCELKNENRTIVMEGLKLLPQIDNAGLQRIIENSGTKKSISSEDVGFRLSPRINAAGRLSDPLIAFQALTNGQGKAFADQLEQLNYERQELTRESMNDIEEKFDEGIKEKIILTRRENLHPGIIGLIAGRLAEKHNRPAVVMSQTGDKVTGSCRSPLETFNITEALAESSDLLNKFGGHRAAAGFTINTENLEQFEEQLHDFAESKISDLEIIPKLTVEMEVEEKNLTDELFRKIKHLEPFGCGNPPPVLLIKDIDLDDIRRVGNDERHLRLKIGRSKLVGIGFGLGEFAEKIEQKKKADIAFHLDENVWNGSRSLQLKIVDVRFPHA